MCTSIDPNLRNYESLFEFYKVLIQNQSEPFTYDSLFKECTKTYNIPNSSKNKEILMKALSMLCESHLLEYKGEGVFEVVPINKLLYTYA